MDAYKKTKHRFKLVMGILLSLFKIFCLKLISGFVRFRLNQTKSVFFQKVEKRQAKSVFLFKNLRMSVFVSSNAFFKIKLKCEFI